MNFVRGVGVLSVTAAVISSLVGVAPVAVSATELTSAFIVELAPGGTALDVSSEVAKDLNTDIEINETFDTLLDGFSAELTPSEVEALQASPDVLAVYPDLPVSINGTQTNAPWNLSRLDQDTAPADPFYTYPDSAGSGARIYVVDTGVAANSAQFGSRLLPGFDAISGRNGRTDCHGHGTHVAGTVASTTYGVAKRASIVPVRVFGCGGPTNTATVISGLDWITRNHPVGTPGIVNLSLGGPHDPSVPDALSDYVNRMSDQGFVMVVAAGNNTDNACNYSPARAAKALTVAATTFTDARSSFSNFGACVDFFAPGSSIESLRWDNPSGSAVMSGTSMAAPHVAGVAALVWAADFSRTARTVEARIGNDSVAGVVSDPRVGSPNQLLWVAPAPAPSSPPSASSTRVAGGDRYSTSVSISQAGFPTANIGSGVPELFVASGENFPDALSAGPVVSQLGGPVLLTAVATLPASVRAEIIRLNPQKIVVVGGAAAVSATVEWQLQSLASSVVRLGGASRYETSRLVTEYGFSRSGARVAYIAAGESFADALAAGAAAGSKDAPIILVPGQAGSVDGATLMLLRNLRVTQIFVVGGEGAVSAGVANSLRGVASVVRLSGGDRLATAQAVNREAFGDAQRAYLAYAFNFPDALGGGVLASVRPGPLFTVPGDCVPAAVLSEIRRVGASEVVLLGGAGVLNARVASLTPCS